MMGWVRYSTSELAALLLNQDFEPEPVDVKERLARIVIAEPRLKGVGKIMVVTTVEDLNKSIENKPWEK